MITHKGVVKENVVVLEEGAHLPEGAEVEVRLIERPAARAEAFARVLSSRIGRHVGMDELIEEDKKEREEHADRWLKP